MLKIIEGPTIQAGESLSDIVDCSAGEVVRINMPAAWDGKKTVLTFQVSTDGETFHELYDKDGHAVTLKEIVPNASVVVPMEAGRAASFVRFRSGGEGTPEPQEEARVFSVVILVTEKTVPVMVYDPVEGGPKPPKPRPPRPKIARKKRRT